MLRFLWLLCEAMNFGLSDLLCLNIGDIQSLFNEIWCQLTENRRLFMKLSKKFKLKTRIAKEYAVSCITHSAWLKNKWWYWDSIVYVVQGCKATETFWFSFLRTKEYTRGWEFQFRYGSFGHFKHCYDIKFLKFILSTILAQMIRIALEVMMKQIVCHKQNLRLMIK